MGAALPMSVYRDLADVPSGAYGCIYADPPWKYGYWGKDTKTKRRAEDHYRVMKHTEIAAMDVARIARPDAWLCMWVTGPTLYDSELVVRSWGFVLTSIGWVWLKKNRGNRGWFMGMGNTTRANAELCLLCRRGHPGVVSHGERQVVEENLPDGELVVTRRGRHSAKPKEMYERIRALVGDVPTIELFCRGPTAPGWDAFGNEAAEFGRVA